MGARLNTAEPPNRATELQLQATLVCVICSSVDPAWMYRKLGGATPRKVPQKNGDRGTSRTGLAILISQFGTMGVTRRKII